MNTFSSVVMQVLDFGCDLLSVATEWIVASLSFFLGSSCPAATTNACRVSTLQDRVVDISPYPPHVSHYRR